MNLTQLINEKTLIKASGSDINTGTNDSKFVTPKAIADSYLAKLYPIGSIYMNAANSTNPATLLGFGTWEAFGAGRVPVGFDSGDSDFNSSEKTGGAKTINIAHQHQMPLGWDSSNIYYSGVNTMPEFGSTVYTTPRFTASVGGVTTEGARLGYTKTNLSATQTVLQPYITCYMWKRTA